MLMNATVFYSIFLGSWKPVELLQVFQLWKPRMRSSRLGLNSPFSTSLQEGGARREEGERLALIFQALATCQALC